MNYGKLQKCFCKTLKIFLKLIIFCETFGISWESLENIFAKHFGNILRLFLGNYGNIFSKGNIFRKGNIFLVKEIF